MDTHSNVVTQEMHPAAAFHQSPALDRLIALTRIDDPLAMPGLELRALQIEAARDVFASHRRKVHVLRRRAEDAQCDDIRDLADIVPLLLPHTVYKSYPLSFLRKGRWDNLLRWFQTLVSTNAGGVNLEGVDNIDDFIDRLHAAGHRVMTSTGTSGKISFLDRIETDFQLYDSWLQGHFCWPKAMPSQKLRFLQLTPRYGPYIMMAVADLNIRTFSSPEIAHFMSNGRMLISDLMRGQEMKEAIAGGSATPDEISAFEEETKVKATKALAEFDAISDLILEHRHDPMVLAAQAGMLWRLLEKARASGIQDGEFHPASVLMTGGGAKGLAVPPDYLQQIYNFLGPIHHRLDIYGCSEMSVAFPACEHGHYHPIPWVIPFVLDRQGQTLLPHYGGKVEGRFAFMDLSYCARWGGLITGDKVTMDYAETCACGRPGPVVVKGSINRYSDLGEEDKITCSGTIESYVRGATI